MLSFVSFYSIPDYIFASAISGNSDNNLYDIISIFWIVGFIFDPFICIFLCKPTRRKFHNLFCGGENTHIRSGQQNVRINTDAD